MENCCKGVKNNSEKHTQWKIILEKHYDFQKVYSS